MCTALQALTRLQLLLRTTQGSGVPRTLPRTRRSRKLIELPLPVDPTYTTTAATAGAAGGIQDTDVSARRTLDAGAGAVAAGSASGGTAGKQGSLRKRADSVYGSKDAAAQDGEKQTPAINIAGDTAADLGADALRVPTQGSGHGGTPGGGSAAGAQHGAPQLVPGSGPVDAFGLVGRGGVPDASHPAAQLAAQLRAGKASSHERWSAGTPPASGHVHVVANDPVSHMMHDAFVSAGPQWQLEIDDRASGKVYEAIPRIEQEQPVQPHVSHNAHNVDGHAYHPEVQDVATGGAAQGVASGGIADVTTGGVPLPDVVQIGAEHAAAARAAQAAQLDAASEARGAAVQAANAQGAGVADAAGGGGATGADAAS